MIKFDKKRVLSILVILTIVFAVSRLIFLDADPSIFKRISDIGDEGYWGYEARSKVLFGNWMVDDFNQSLATAPLYAWLSYGVFKLLGVSFYTARLIPALSGILSIGLLYLIVKKYNKDLAIVSSFILSISEVFFMYNRIGHVESLVLMFLLLMFYFITGKEKLQNQLYTYASYFGGGVSFLLAVLSKLTTAYFAIVLLIYFVLMLYRKECKFKHILAFGFGSGIVAVPFMAFYYLPNMDNFKVILKALSGDSSIVLNSLVHLYQFMSANYLSFVSVFLLVLLTLIYFKKRNIFMFFSDLKRNVLRLTNLELLAFSWLVGYLIGILPSDFTTRRFIYLIIPLVLFSSMALVNEKKEAFSGKSCVNIFSLGLTALIGLNAIHLPILFISTRLNLKTVFEKIAPTTLIEKFKLWDPVVFTRNSLFLLFLAAAGLAVIVMYWVFVVKKYKTIIGEKIMRIGAAGVFVFILCFNFIYKNVDLLSVFNITLGLKIVGISSLVVFVLVAVVLWSKRALPIVSVIFVAFCVVNILGALIFPSFSTRNTAKEIAAATSSNEWIIGPLAHEMSLESNLKPIWWIPNYKDYVDVNSNCVDKYKPKYFLVATYSSEDKSVSDDNWMWPSKAQVNKELKYVDSYQVYKVFGKSRFKMDLYEIEY